MADKTSRFSASCRFGKMSFRRKVRSSYCPFDKMSVRLNVRRQNVRSAKCLSAKCLSAKCLSVKCPATPGDTSAVFQILAAEATNVNLTFAKMASNILEIICAIKDEIFNVFLLKC